MSDNQAEVQKATRKPKKVTKGKKAKKSTKGAKRGRKPGRPKASTAKKAQNDSLKFSIEIPQNVKLSAEEWTLLNKYRV